MKDEHDILFAYKELSEDQYNQVKDDDEQLFRDLKYIGSHVIINKEEEYEKTQKFFKVLNQLNEV